jgi:hypothetical protein
MTINHQTLQNQVCIVTYRKELLAAQIDVEKISTGHSVAYVTSPNAYSVVSLSKDGSGSWLAKTVNSTGPFFRGISRESRELTVFRALERGY